MNNFCKNDFLPYNVKEVIMDMDNDAVIVNLWDGKKGISKVNHSEDALFDAYIGFCIAYYKSMNPKSFDLKQVLENCMLYAIDKGYNKAVLKNYDGAYKE